MFGVHAASTKWNRLIGASHRSTGRRGAGATRRPRWVPSLVSPRRRERMCRIDPGAWPGAVRPPGLHLHQSENRGGDRQYPPPDTGRNRGGVQGDVHEGGVGEQELKQHHPGDADEGPRVASEPTTKHRPPQVSAVEQVERSNITKTLTETVRVAVSACLVPARGPLKILWAGARDLTPTSARAPLDLPPSRAVGMKTASRSEPWKPSF